MMDDDKGCKERQKYFRLLLRLHSNKQTNKQTKQQHKKKKTLRI